MARKVRGLDPSAALGKVLADRRKQADLRQEDIAEEAQALGLAWTRATVAAVETGRRQLSANELILLPYVLSLATMEPVSLTGLFEQADPVELTDSITVEGSDVASYASGERARELIWATSDDKEPTELERRLAARFGISVERLITKSVELWGKRYAAVRDERVQAATRARGSDGPDSLAEVARLRSHFARALVEELRLTLPE